MVAGICALLAVTLGVLPAPGPVDDVAWAAVGGWPHGLLRVLVLPTEPYVLIPAIGLLALWRRRHAVFIVLTPVVTVAVNTWVLKPLFDRWKGDTLVYPSGHTVSLVATLALVLVLTSRRTRTITVGAVLVIAATIGMVGLGYHYVTDVAGGTLFALAVVLGVTPPGSAADSRWFVLSRKP